MAAPQLDLLFLAVAVLGGIASLAFFVAWLADMRQNQWVTLAGSIVGLSASWYCVSMSLTLFNRMMLGYTPFSFPITMSLSHMAVKGLLGIGLALEAHRRTLAPASLPPSFGARLKYVARSLVKSQKLNWIVFSRVLVPLGTTTAIDIWLSAVSLQTLDVSVYTTAKSCALIFTLIFSLAARLQKLSPSLIGTCLLIGAGVIMCSIKEEGSVDPTGLVAVLVAAACGAARWVFTEQFYKRKGVKSNALLLVALLSPITVITLVPGLGWEVPRLITHSPVHTSGDVMVVLSMTLGGGVLAFLLLIVELSLVSMTSALTLNVIGHLKDVVVIGLAIPVLHEELSPLNAAGVGLTIAATCLYSYQKSRSHAQAAQATAAAAAARALEETWADPEPGDAIVAASGLAAAGPEGAASKSQAQGLGASPDDDVSEAGVDAGAGATPGKLRKARRKGGLGKKAAKYQGVPSGDLDEGDGDSDGGGVDDEEEGEDTVLSPPEGKGLVLSSDALGPLVPQPAHNPHKFIIEEEDGDDDATQLAAAVSVSAADDRPALAHDSAEHRSRLSSSSSGSGDSGSGDSADGEGGDAAGIGELEVSLAQPERLRSSSRSGDDDVAPDEHPRPQS